MMTVLSVSSLGLGPLWQELLSARSVVFWLILGGFVWVIGDISSNTPAKYVGIKPRHPVSNSNQLWGLLWGILVSANCTAAILPSISKSSAALSL